jgi:uncharacterized protein YgbK (DUF1537 family)
VATLHYEDIFLPKPKLHILNAHAGIPVHGQAVIPAFFEGGRYTFDDIHWILQDGMLVPVGQSEYARDPVFSFESSNLVNWVLEKSEGSINREMIVPISLETIRHGGIEAVYEVVRGTPKDSIVICNAMSYSDLRVLACGFLMAEKKGVNYLYRTAASFVPALTGIPLPIAFDYKLMVISPPMT